MFGWSKLSRKGLVHIYYGNGKGKTTAAIGLLLRTVAYSSYAALLMFLKNQKNRYGEVRTLTKAPFKRYLLLRCLGSGCRHGEKTVCDGCGDCHIEPDNIRPDDIHAAERGLQLADSLLSSGDYHLVVLDEILYALSFRLLKVDDVVDVIMTRAPSTEVVLTGRGVFERLFQQADYITHMQEIKHHYKGEESPIEAVDY